jgi:hypothetical protein
MRVGGLCTCGFTTEGGSWTEVSVMLDAHAERAHRGFSPTKIEWVGRDRGLQPESEAPPEGNGAS